MSHPGDDTWAPCDARLTEGWAEFDGLRIQADPITDPRRDRVFPIAEEEQVFVCRQMLPRLRQILGSNPDALILDVGTGSGVFAIAAARAGMRAVGVDISERALSFAKENASRNGIMVAETFDNLMPGQVCFILEQFDETYAAGHVEGYDVVLVNAPYNPTCPGIFPALHAEAGEDGQLAFNRQIASVPQVLRPGGVCIGNQFSTVDTDGRILALDRIDDAFGTGSHTRYARIVAQDIDARSFLEGVYAGYLTDESHDMSSMVRQYIDRVLERFAGFALIYFETTKTTRLPDGHACDEEEFALRARPPQGWPERIAFHRYVVDYVEGTTEPGPYTG